MVDWSVCQVVSTVLIPTAVALAGWVQYERREAVRAARETREMMSQIIRELMALIASHRPPEG